MNSSKLRALQFVTILKLFASCVTKVMKNMIIVIIDDMEIFPTSTIKSIVLLNKLKVENTNDLDSLEIVVGITQLEFHESMLEDLVKTQIINLSLLLNL
jgi:hypothetical protein